MEHNHAVRWGEDFGDDDSEDSEVENNDIFDIDKDSDSEEDSDLDEEATKAMWAIKKLNYRSEVKKARILSEKLTLRLHRRAMIIDIIKKSYLRDIVVMKDVMNNVLKGSDKEEILKEWESTIPSIDLRGVLALHNPAASTLSMKPCSACGGTVDIEYHDSVKATMMMKQIAKLKERNEQVRLALVVEEAKTEKLTKVYNRETKRVEDEKQFIYGEMKKIRESSVTQTATIKALQGENTSMKEEVKEFRKVAADLDESRIINQELEIVQIQLRATIEKLKEELKDAEEKAAKDLETIESKSRNIASLEQTCSRQYRESIEAEEKYNETVEKFTKEIKVHTGKSERDAALIEELRNAGAATQNELNKMRMEYALDMEQNEQAMEARQKDIESLESRVNTLRDSNRVMEKTIAEYQAKEQVLNSIIKQREEEGEHYLSIARKAEEELAFLRDNSLDASARVVYSSHNTRPGTVEDENLEHSDHEGHDDEENGEYGSYRYNGLELPRLRSESNASEEGFEVGRAHSMRAHAEAIKHTSGGKFESPRVGYDYVPDGVDPNMTLVYDLQQRQRKLSEGGLTPRSGRSPRLAKDTSPKAADAAPVVPSPVPPPADQVDYSKLMKRAPKTTPKSTPFRSVINSNKPLPGSPVIADTPVDAPPPVSVTSPKITTGKKLDAESLNEENDSMTCEERLLRSTIAASLSSSIGIATAKRAMNGLGSVLPSFGTMLNCSMKGFWESLILVKQSSDFYCRLDSILKKLVNVQDEYAQDVTVQDCEGIFEECMKIADDSHFTDTSFASWRQTIDFNTDLFQDLSPMITSALNEEGVQVDTVKFREYLEYYGIHRQVGNYVPKCQKLEENLIKVREYSEKVLPMLNILLHDFLKEWILIKKTRVTFEECLDNARKGAVSHLTLEMDGLMKELKSAYERLVESQGHCKSLTDRLESSDGELLILRPLIKRLEEAETMGRSLMGKIDEMAAQQDESNSQYNIATRAISTLNKKNSELVLELDGRNQKIDGLNQEILNLEEVIERKSNHIYNQDQRIQFMLEENDRRLHALQHVALQTDPNMNDLGTQTEFLCPPISLRTSARVTNAAKLDRYPMVYSCYPDTHNASNISVDLVNHNRDYINSASSVENSDCVSSDESVRSMGKVRRDELSLPQPIITADPTPGKLKRVHSPGLMNLSPKNNLSPESNYGKSPKPKGLKRKEKASPNRFAGFSDDMGEDDAMSVLTNEDSVLLPESARSEDGSVMKPVIVAINNKSRSSVVTLPINVDSYQIGREIIGVVSSNALNDSMSVKSVSTASKSLSQSVLNVMDSRSIANDSFLSERCDNSVHTHSAGSLGSHTATLSLLSVPDIRDTSAYKNLDGFLIYQREVESRDITVGSETMRAMRINGVRGGGNTAFQKAKFKRGKLLKQRSLEPLSTLPSLSAYGLSVADTERNNPYVKK